MHVTSSPVTPINIGSRVSLSSVRGRTFQVVTWIFLGDFEMLSMKVFWELLYFESDAFVRVVKGIWRGGGLVVGVFVLVDVNPATQFLRRWEGSNTPGLTKLGGRS